MKGNQKGYYSSAASFGYNVSSERATKGDLGHVSLWKGIKGTGGSPKVKVQCYEILLAT